MAQNFARYPPFLCYILLTTGWLGFLLWFGIGIEHLRSIRMVFFFFMDGGLGLVLRMGMGIIWEEEEIEKTDSTITNSMYDMI